MIMERQKEGKAASGKRPWRDEKGVCSEQEKQQSVKRSRIEP